MAWLERGGVLAYANVRGSGAFGDSWHRAGFKATKANTWKDGIACANYLIAQSFPVMASGLGLATSYTFYGVCAVISYFLVKRFIHETKGKELEQMEG